MEYRFREESDESLISVSELPVEKGIAVALRTTGYDAEDDEVVELSIVDFSGNELFSHVVKPQNVETWDNDDASGGITASDVQDAPELYQFEDEIINLFENASIVIAAHMAFAKSMIEASWISLPDFEGFDLVERFRESHCTVDYPDKPATVATLNGIAQYFSIPSDASGRGETVEIARTIASCYLKLIQEHASQREEKGEKYWKEYARKQEEAERNDLQLQAAKKNREIKSVRINAILWLCAAAVFSNLAVQMGVREFDLSIVMIIAALSIFFAIRWILCLYTIFKLRKH